MYMGSLMPDFFRSADCSDRVGDSAYNDEAVYAADQSQCVTASYNSTSFKLEVALLRVAFADSGGSKLDMALFAPAFDLEAGEQPEETWTGTGRLQPVAPTLLVPRAQNSQRFVAGEAFFGLFAML